MAQMLRVPLLATLPSLSLHLLASWGALPTHPCHHPKGSWTKSVHGCRNGGDTCSITWTSTHPGWPGYSHCWVPNLPVTETKTLYSTIHHGDHLAMLWQVYYTGLLPSWRSSTFFFFLTGRKLLLWIQVCHPCLQYFCQNYNPWYCTQHCFWSRNSFHSKRSEAMETCSWNPLFLTMFPTILKQLAW